MLLKNIKFFLVIVHFFEVHPGSISRKVHPGKFIHEGFMKVLFMKVNDWFFKQIRD